MIVLFIFLGAIGWLTLGTLGYVIYQKFGDDNIEDEFGLLLILGGISFVLSVLLVCYERFRDFITNLV